MPKWYLFLVNVKGMPKRLRSFVQNIFLWINIQRMKQYLIHCTVFRVTGFVAPRARTNRWIRYNIRVTPEVLLGFKLLYPQLSTKNKRVIWIHKSTYLTFDIWTWFASIRHWGKHWRRVIRFDDLINVILCLTFYTKILCSLVTFCERMSQQLSIFLFHFNIPFLALFTTLNSIFLMI